MTRLNRRTFLGASAAALALPPALARAVTIDAHVRTGTIKDVEHVVILMQENRSFDHYFGTMNGVRGFGDRFPVPVADSAGRTGANVWTQANATDKGGPALVAPFALNTAKSFELMRVEGTPHNWADAQGAWDNGRMGHWAAAKGAHAMGHYEKADIPFQYALADAFTLCDAYHCSFQGGTNTNRLFLWTGTNDGEGKGGGPSISNTHDHLPKNPTDKAANAYRWTTYSERLQAAGIDWRIYEDMADNFGDNPLIGFQAYRESLARGEGADPQLAARGLSTQHLDVLKADVLAGKLPQVSWVISPAKDSEHPGPSSPAQGADYTARVIDALTADPKVWAKTVLLVTFDENDGFFDHVPPPAPPGRDETGELLGASTVDTAGEYHLVRSPADPGAERDALMGRPYGLGPRVPMYVISPWSRGGWVNSQVFDHTSVIRFLEARFGVEEPNITPWRRAVCGDLTSAFDFKTPNEKPFPANLPATAADAARAAALPGRTMPPTPAEPAAPVQAAGVRPSRALPYDISVTDEIEGDTVRLIIRNAGQSAAVIHVYDRLRLDQGPRRYTVEPGKVVRGDWPNEVYDLWLLGPNGFHRHYAGRGAGAPLFLALAVKGKNGAATVLNRTSEPLRVTLVHNAYGKGKSATVTLKPAPGDWKSALDLKASHGWYDVTLRPADGDAWLHRMAGRIETGADSITDPAITGAAIMRQT
ncbi:MAG: phospholipase C, phosphocholine-specific [Alphaproteobacteria bacterium]|nr:phospholipase C, phosphocholine-specific [Alphaproteobacteria bacterium]